LSGIIFKPVQQLLAACPIVQAVDAATDFAQGQHAQIACLARAGLDPIDDTVIGPLAP